MKIEGANLKKKTPGKGVFMSQKMQQYTAKFWRISEEWSEGYFIAS